jgi:cell division protein FtsL
MPGEFAPSARAGASSPRRARTAGKPRSRAGGAQLTVPRVRWDRLGRLAMLFVLAALLYLYLSAGTRMLSTWHQSRHDSATVASMEREHASLVRQREALGRQGTVEQQARRLGMKKANERSYVISGLPAN